MFILIGLYQLRQSVLLPSDHLLSMQHIIIRLYELYKWYYMSSMLE